MPELQNAIEKNNSYFSTVSYKTTMSIIKNIEQIAMALYMVTDCVEDDEPIRIEARNAILTAMKFASKIISSPQISSTNFRHIHSNLILVRNHIFLLETMGYISTMNANILLLEIDKLLSKLDSSIIDTDSSHKAQVELRKDMSFGIDLGNVFYSQNNLHQTSTTTEEKGNNTEQTTNESSISKPLGKLEKEITHIQRKSLILKLFRETPSIDGQKEMSMNELLTKYTRYGGEGAISEKTLSREMNDLVLEKTIEKIGSKRWVKYRLIKN